MVARTRSAQAGVGLGVNVGVGDGVGLAEGEPQAELTAITNRRRAISLARYSLSDEFFMAWVSTWMDIRCPFQRAAPSLLSSTGPSRAPICPVYTGASADCWRAARRRPPFARCEVSMQTRLRRARSR